MSVIADVEHTTPVAPTIGTLTGPLCPKDSTMSVLTHTTTALEAATLVTQGKLPVDGQDGLLSWLERTLIPMSQLKHLRTVLDSDQFCAVIDAQDVLDKASRKLADETAKAAAASMDSTKPYAKKKTACAITREEFAAHAEALEVSIGESTIEATVKEQFSSGSFGWNINGKMEVMVNGERVKVQVSGNLIVVGSKEA